MLRKDLAAALGISASMVTRLARQGMPTADVESAKKWRDRHLSTARRKEYRADYAIGDAAADGGKGSRDEPAHAAPATVADRAGAPLPPGGESDYWVSRASRERAEAAIAGLKLAEMKGDLVRLADVTREVGQQAVALRNALMQIDARLAPLVAIEPDVGRCQALIREELRSVLERLSQIEGDA